MTERRRTGHILGTLISYSFHVKMTKSYKVRKLKKTCSMDGVQGQIRSELRSATLNFRVGKKSMDKAVMYGQHRKLHATLILGVRNMYVIFRMRQNMYGQGISTSAVVQVQ
jgi:hypothetical protein